MRLFITTFLNIGITFSISPALFLFSWGTFYDPGAFRSLTRLKIARIFEDVGVLLSKPRSGGSLLKTQYQAQDFLSCLPLFNFSDRVRLFHDHGFLVKAFFKIGLFFTFDRRPPSKIKIFTFIDLFNFSLPAEHIYQYFFFIKVHFQ